MDNYTLHYRRAVSTRGWLLPMLMTGQVKVA